MNETAFYPIDGSTSYFDFNDMKQAGFYRMVGRFSDAKNAPPQYYGDASMIVTATHESLAQIVVSPGGIIDFRTTNFDGKQWHQWYHLCTAEPPQVYDLSLLEGIIPAGRCVYWKNQFNEVTVCFVVKKADGSAFIGPWETNIATLPVGYCPDGWRYNTGFSCVGDPHYPVGIGISGNAGILSVYTTHDGIEQTTIAGQISFIASLENSDAPGL